LLAGTGCSDGGKCGPAGAPPDGLTVVAGGVTLTYSDLVGSPNNDCPDPAAPSGIISLTVTGTQVGGAGFFTVCVPRPDKLNTGLALGTDIQLVDISGSSATCTYALDSSQPATGTATAKGACSNGTASAGFAWTFDGTGSVHRTCSTTTDTVTVQIAGTVAVAGPHQSNAHDEEGRDSFDPRESTSGP
jgi:hypothetical protein